MSSYITLSAKHLFDAENNKLKYPMKSWFMLLDKLDKDGWLDTFIEANPQLVEQNCAIHAKHILNNTLAMRWMKKVNSNLVERFYLEQWPKTMSQQDEEWITLDSKLLNTLCPKVLSSLRFSDKGKFWLSLEQLVAVEAGHCIKSTYDQWFAFYTSLSKEESKALNELAPELKSIALEMSSWYEVPSDSEVKLSANLVRAMESTVGLKLKSQRLNLDACHIPWHPSLSESTVENYFWQKCAELWFKGRDEAFDSVWSSEKPETITFGHFIRSLETLGQIDKWGKLNDITQKILHYNTRALSQYVKALGSIEQGAGALAEMKQVEIAFSLKKELIASLLVLPALDAFLKDKKHHGNKSLTIEHQSAAELLESGKMTMNVVSLLENIPYEIENIAQLIDRIGYQRVEGMAAELAPYLQPSGFSAIGEVQIDAMTLDMLHPRYEFQQDEKLVANLIR